MMLWYGLVVSFVISFYIAWSIGANDETMAVLAGSGFTSIGIAALIGAGMDLLGAVLLGYKIEETLGRGIVAAEIHLSDALTLLLAVALWLTVASLRGWPVSTTHALVGALIGLGVSRWGFDGVNWGGLYGVMAGWVLSPMAGFAIAYALTRAFGRLFMRRIRNLPGRLRLSRASSILLLAWSSVSSFFRGANDVGNATAFLSLIYGSPVLVRFMAGLGMALGLIVLGRRVIKSVGLTLVELTPDLAMIAQIAVASAMSVGTWLGLPLSGTHVLVAAIAGIGTARGTWINYRG
ncbi:TPA: inorganic phosphate transporter, partial [Candidatus Bathyarchaeota archaeon]|nr:inorganic phosphate transporter [Candidatus Bathyarchaeota archaeon]